MKRHLSSFDQLSDHRKGHPSPALAQPSGDNRSAVNSAIDLFR